MSGNSKQRRQFRRRLAREGMTYVPPSDWRRRLLAPDVYLELPPVFSSYEHPGLAHVLANLPPRATLADALRHMPVVIEDLSSGPVTRERSLDHLINSWYGSPVAPFDVRSMVAAMDGDEPKNEEDTTT